MSSRLTVYLYLGSSQAQCTRILNLSIFSVQPTYRRCMPGWKGNSDMMSVTGNGDDDHNPHELDVELVWMSSW